MSTTNALVIGSINAVEAYWWPRWPTKNPWTPAAVRQPWNPHVEVHPVDRLDLEEHAIGQDIADTARYGHDGLRFVRAASRPASRSKRFIHPIDTRSTRVFIPSAGVPSSAPVGMAIPSYRRDIALKEVGPKTGASG